MARAVRPLNIKDAEVYEMARTLSERTGESLTEVVRKSLRERLSRQAPTPQERELMMEKIQEIADHCASLPDLDTRTPDEIIGYDENGIPA